MAIVEADAREWSMDQLLTEYDSRIVTAQALSGWLYRSIIADELSLITAIAIERWNCHPNDFVDRGHVFRTWSDAAQIVHDWRGRLECGAGLQSKLNKQDHPTRAVSCVYCLWRWP